MTHERHKMLESVATNLFINLLFVTHQLTNLSIFQRRLRHRSNDQGANYYHSSSDPIRALLLGEGRKKEERGGKGKGGAIFSPQYFSHVGAFGFAFD